MPSSNALPQKRPALVFDFDFTLADSSKGFLACHEYALDALGLPPVPAEKALRTVGLPLAIAFEHLVGAQRAALTDEYVWRWQARADAVMTGLTVLLPGVAASVRALREAGAALAIVSQKLRYRIEAVLERDGLLDAFDLIVGGGDMIRFKPDPEGLLIAVQRLGRAPGETPYVGDTVIDAEAALRASMPFVAVLTGVTKREEFAGLDAVAVLESVADLPGIWPTLLS